MIRKSTGKYPDNWKEIANQVKNDAAWRCVRCGHSHDIETGYVLTVHHLDINPSNCAWWNIPPLCQRCHLHIQAKVVMEQDWMFGHSEWFKPYVAGYYAHLNGLPENKEYVNKNLDDLLKMGAPSHRKHKRIEHRAVVEDTAD